MESLCLPQGSEVMDLLHFTSIRMHQCVCMREEVKGEKMQKQNGMRQQKQQQKAQITCDMGKGGGQCKLSSVSIGKKPCLLYMRIRT